MSSLSSSYLGFAAMDSAVNPWDPTPRRRLSIETFCSNTSSTCSSTYLGFLGMDPSGNHGLSMVKMNHDPNVVPLMLLPGVDLETYKATYASVESILGAHIRNQSLLCLLGYTLVLMPAAIVCENSSRRGASKKLEKLAQEQNQIYSSFGIHIKVHYTNNSREPAGLELYTTA